VEFQSPAWLDHCREQAGIQTRTRRAEARVQIEQALTKARRERLADFAALLEPLLRAAEARSDLSIGALLKTFGESQRSDLYAALWHLSAASRKTRYAAIVSGQETLLFEPSRLDQPARRLGVTDCLGPLRSVRTDARAGDAGVLMVGARLGLHLLDLESGHVARSLPIAVVDPDQVQGGVNAAAMTDERIYATHSEAGLLAWPREGGSSPAEELLTGLTGPADTVRSVQAADGHIWLSIDEDVWALAIDDARADRPIRYPGSTARLSALKVADGAVFGGNINGQILAWHVGDPDSVRVLRGATGNPVESIGVVQAGGVDHLVVADRGHALQALVVDDGYVRRYESGALPVRRAAVAEDLFVAMNDNRDRLIAWDPRTPGEPAAAVVIPYLTGNTIQDLCLVPATA
jgi:hypothetical protein